jgi:hypothetical protein
VHEAWLAWFLQGIGVLRREEMVIRQPPDLDMVAQAVLHWAGSCRQQLLHAGATVQNASTQRFRMLDHIHICMLGCAFHIRWC